MADYGGMTLAYSLFKQKKMDEGLQGAALARNIAVRARAWRNKNSK